MLLGDGETGIESGANIYRMWRSAKSVGGNSGEAVRGGEAVSWMNMVGGGGCSEPCTEGHRELGVMLGQHHV